MLFLETLMIFLDNPRNKGPGPGRGQGPTPGPEPLITTNEAADDNCDDDDADDRDKSGHQITL